MMAGHELGISSCSWLVATFQRHHASENNESQSTMRNSTKSGTQLGKQPNIKKRGNKFPPPARGPPAAPAAGHMEFSVRGGTDTVNPHIGINMDERACHIGIANILTDKILVLADIHWILGTSGIWLHSGSFKRFLRRQA